MRLFTGLDLPAEVVHNLEQLLERLRPTARIHWTFPANLHITTKFIGEWPIPVHVCKVGFFPNPHAPRVFWCGIEAPGLETLAEHTDGATAALGIARETRAFSPHLTLARIKERLDLQPLRQAVAALPSLDFGEFQAASFFLYQSTLKPSGSVYTKLAEFPLAKR
jgi:2'-5' RNA ligase